MMLPRALEENNAIAEIIEWAVDACLEWPGQTRPGSVVIESMVLALGQGL